MRAGVRPQVLLLLAQGHSPQARQKKLPSETENKFHRIIAHNRSARTSNSTEEESCAEDFEFAEGSAQFWVSRNVGDGIVLPKDTRDTIDRDILCAI